jgi:pimeloyl-ACP methyl ester carboxylesterase
VAKVLDTDFELVGVDGRFDSTISASVITPDASTPAGEVVVAVPGGNYTRWYWNADQDVLPGYSCAEYLAARGHVVVAIDNFGTGRSTRPEGIAPTAETLAAVINRVAREVRARTQDGTLAPDLAAVPSPRLVGIGHSMGGMLTQIVQATYGTYDRIGVLGYTALTPPDLAGVPIADRVVERIADRRQRWASGDEVDYLNCDLADVRDFCHGTFVDDEIVGIDTAHATVLPVHCSASAATYGYTTELASTITVPVFIGLGEQDLSFAPHKEPEAYSSSRDITLYILQGAAHCHNFAPTRVELWNRLHSWMSATAR